MTYTKSQDVALRALIRWCNSEDRFIRMVGLAGTGKCVPGFVRVETSEGYCRIDSLVKNPVEGSSPYITKVMTRKGVKNSSHFYYEKNCKVYELKTNNGSFYGTADHKLLSLNSDGEPELIKISEIKEGSYLLLVKDSSLHIYPENDKISASTAYLLGFYCGDGCRVHNYDSLRDKHYWNYSLENHDNILSYVKEYCGLSTKVTSRLRYGKKYQQIRISKKDISIIQIYEGLDSSSKFVPEEVFQSSKKVRQAFLLGYLDTDGYVSNDGNNDFVSKSKKLIRGIKDLMNSLGVFPKESLKRISVGKYKGNVYYRLRVRSEELSKLFEGFDEVTWSRKLLTVRSYKSSSVNSTDFVILNKYWKNKNLKSCGIVGPIKYDLLRDREVFTVKRIRSDFSYIPPILEEMMRYYYVKIESKTEFISDVYDLTVPEEHEFVAQGIVNHNTHILTLLGKMVESGELKTNIAFVAPTGRAAANLNVKGIPATTIHGLIYKVIDDGMTIRFIKRESIDPSIKIIAVDEASMVTKEMYKDLVSFGTKILFVGDQGQLPPVGNDARCLSNPELTLHEIVRQAEDNPIVVMANKFYRGEPLRYGSYGGHFVISPHRELTPEQYLKADQVLVATNKTRIAINKLVRSYKKFVDLIPVKGDKLICTRNKWDCVVDGIPLVNGMLCYCDKSKLRGRDRFLLQFHPEFSEELSVVEATIKPFVNIPDLVVKGGLAYFDFGYAITVWKAQGSEWDNVIYKHEKVCPEVERKLLYTAMTRAKRGLFMML